MFDRMRRGWDLTKKSWGVVRSHPSIARLPVYGGLLALLVMVVFAGPGALLLATDDPALATQVLGGVLVAIGIYLASFAVTYFNVALAAAAEQALAGGDPDVAAARRAARDRIGVIAQWALLTVVVSAVLAFVRDRGGAAGGLFAAIGGAIWGLVTFLVVPVLAFEGLGPIDATKRSAGLFRERWGQQVTGNVAIGGIAGLVMLVGILLGVGGVFLLVSGGTAGEVGGGVLLALGVVVGIAAAVFSGAVRGVFGVALYHFVTEEAAVGPFTTAELEQTARAK